MEDSQENYDDRRRAPRSDIQDTLFIKSISSSQVTSLQSDLKTCNTVNVSAYGMQVIIDFEVLVDSEIAMAKSTKKAAKTGMRVATPP